MLLQQLLAAMLYSYLFVCCCCVTYSFVCGAFFWRNCCYVFFVAFVVVFPNPKMFAIVVAAVAWFCLLQLLRANYIIAHLLFDFGVFFFLFFGGGFVVPFSFFFFVALMSLVIVFVVFRIVFTLFSIEFVYLLLAVVVLWLSYHMITIYMLFGLLLLLSWVVANRVF